ncbi:PDZ domain-containing protein [Streptomyces rishiriensis]|uniref:S1-C subfamily serine protease n=1 Tax=Streptomyces rishiriensis TaxID=68264 RepID=A0ABU0NY84_STRRH|nr:PDZ domain-containing protein [Streptomyces rishiriensis]MDQ0584116.1 S1-C subfamily serine protease [Streptomyces rishiriensis]
MEQTALRPKPMPGSEPGGGAGPGGQGRRPHAARRRGRRLTTLLFGLFAGTVLVLSGVGLGTVGATVIGMSRLAELQRQPGPGTAGSPGAASTPGREGRPGSDGASGSAPASARPPDATLGLEAVDAEQTGAEIVAVHIPGPGCTAGLVRGDVLLRFGGTRIDSATDLARAVDEARPGKAVELRVRHGHGGYDRLTVIPGVVT